MDKYEGHTPGPWKAVKGKSFWTKPLIFKKGTDICVAIVEIEDGFESSEANAALIADAPMLLRQNEKMLAELKRISAWATDHDEWWVECENKGGCNVDAIDNLIAETERSNPKQ